MSKTATTITHRLLMSIVPKKSKNSLKKYLSSVLSIFMPNKGSKLPPVNKSNMPGNRSAVRSSFNQKLRRQSTQSNTYSLELLSNRSSLQKSLRSAPELSHEYQTEDELTKELTSDSKIQSDSSKVLRRMTATTDASKIFQAIKESETEFPLEDAVFEHLQSVEYSGSMESLRSNIIK